VISRDDGAETRVKVVADPLFRALSMVLSGGAWYEVICASAFILALAGIRRVWGTERAETLVSVLVVGLFFGVSWEPEGTGLVWSYHGFRIYAFMGIPLAILLSWAWWMILCRLLSERMLRLIERGWGAGSRRLNSVAFFASGLLAASVIEPLSVYLNWWEYLVIGDRAALVFPLLGVSFNLTVIIGWGVLTVVNLTFSELARGLFASGIEGRLGLSRIQALLLSSALLGLISGWASWQLVALFAASVENAAPRLFLTRDHIYILEGLTGAQLATLLLLASAILYYLWKKTRRRDEFVGSNGLGV